MIKKRWVNIRPLWTAVLLTILVTSVYYLRMSTFWALVLLQLTTCGGEDAWFFIRRILPLCLGNMWLLAKLWRELDKSTDGSTRESK